MFQPRQENMEAVSALETVIVLCNIQEAVGENKTLMEENNQK